jgi:hypothetical protein
MEAGCRRKKPENLGLFISCESCSARAVLASMPGFLDHRKFPLVGRLQNFVLGAADL